jgi:hypothetical protein
MYENRNMDTDKSIVDPGSPESAATEQLRMPLLGSARGTIILKEGWDDGLTDEDLKDWYGD